jgi:Na+-translocating ferredoxin:NAD+ oxidoreductase RnfA subunit
MDFLRAVVTGFATGIGFGFAYLLFRALHLI